MQPFTIRRSSERGHADHGWLKTWHTFSFADYHDPNHMGFRSLRVINDDWVAPGAGFPTHPHRNMEIFSCILSGAIAHRDSMGNARQLGPGEIQVMSAGRGVTHSEFNPLPNEPLHLLQVWILPHTQNLEPGYAEWQPAPEHEASLKVLIISPDGADGSAIIHQDAHIYRIRLGVGQSVTHQLDQGRGLWLHAATGELEADDIELKEGDAISTESPGTLTLTTTSQSEALLFDLG